MTSPPKDGAQALRPGGPLLESWDTPFGAPPFERIASEHFRPAFDEALARHRAEIEVIAANREPPSFANSIEALERSGQALQRVAATFFNLAAADTNAALQAIEREIAPVLARHKSAIHMDERLFRRIDDLYRRRDELDLTPEQRQVLRRHHVGFIRSGAALAPEAKERLTAIVQRLATLGTQFSQNVLADESAYALVLESEDDLAGMPDFLRDAAARAAADRGLAGKYVVTLARSSIEPFLQFSSRRDLREAAWRAWTARGETAGPSDNRSIAAETVALRAERARLLGYRSFAHFRLDDSMAKTPQAALDLLRSVWVPARDQAMREQKALQAMISAEGGNHDLAPWDWRYWSERRRKAMFDLDESGIKPYLQLDNAIAAAFDTANRLFGLSFAERFDVPAYHADVRVWEVTGDDGRHVGLFMGDYFARASKRSGAWMSTFRPQHKLDGDVRPIVVNVMNFSKPDHGPALLSFDDARTLFHEFGHGLHGLLSDVTYPTISGTSVARDFVELPSQLYEHWLEQPALLRRHALHYQTGEPMPEALLERILAARSFNQGFATVEYLSCALADLDLHLLDPADAVDLAGFERRYLESISMPEAIVMRHRLPHFLHLFSGDAYAAGYYAYMWSEVLDADGFGAFEEAGDIFHAATAERLHDFIYSAGYARDPDDAFRAFRGRAPDPQALLRRRGLLHGPAPGEA